MDLELLDGERARLIRSDDGTVWCQSKTPFGKRFRVMPENVMSMQLACIMLRISTGQLCGLMDDDVTVIRVSEIRLSAGVAAGKAVAK